MVLSATGSCARFASVRLALSACPPLYVQLSVYACKCDLHNVHAESPDYLYLYYTYVFVYVVSFLFHVFKDVEQSEAEGGHMRGRVVSPVDAPDSLLL